MIRAVKSKRPGLMFFLVAVIFALLASYSAVSVVQSFNAQTMAYMPVQDISPYTKITAEMVALQSVSASSILGTKVEKPEEVIGKYSNSMITKKMPILKEQLIESPGGEITSRLNEKKRLDLRAFPLTTDQISGFGGKLVAGDRIDFIATVSVLSDKGNQLITRMIAQNVPILNRIEDQEKLMGIVVEVTAKEAQEIAHYLEVGKIKFTIHPQPSETQINIEPTVTSGFINPIKKEGK